MKNIVIYNASWNSFGGGEKYACSLAESLSRLDGTQVAILMDKPTITKEQLSKYFNVDLEKVDLRCITPPEINSGLGLADIAIVVSNYKPFGLQAKRNVFIMQIPYPRFTFSRFLRQLKRADIRNMAKDSFRRELLKDLKKSDLVLVYSGFVQNVLKRCHDISSTILYPAIDDFLEEVPKEKIVLSVGRFFSGAYNDKRYDVLIDAFKLFYDRLENKDWQYHLVGSCTDDRRSRRYLARLKEKAKGYPVHFFVNTPYQELKKHYNNATLFWHATGFGLDEESEPERMEHFGMTTVEAMSAKCIPLVIDLGGQREIVTHGLNGYRWSAIEHLLRHSMHVIKGEVNPENLERGARARALELRKEAFHKKVIEIFLPLLR